MRNTRGIVIDGPDGAGKTALARELVRKTQFTYSHWGPPQDGVDPYLYYRDAGAWGPCDERILDRFSLSDVVYGGILNRERHVSVRDYAQNALLDHYDTVVMLPPMRVCEGRSELKEEMFDAPTRIRAWHAWRGIVPVLQCLPSHFIIDTCILSAEQLADLVLDWRGRR